MKGGRYSAAFIGYKKNTNKVLSCAKQDRFLYILLTACQSVFSLLKNRLSKFFHFTYFFLKIIVFNILHTVFHNDFRKLVLSLLTQFIKTEKLYATTV